MLEYKWKVVPLCERQLRDINKSDVLHSGLYRRCDIYKGGGGYDKFEEIYHKRINNQISCNEQFVVQVYGCPFKCPYCYVTPSGIHGEYKEVSSTKLVNDFIETGFSVFHLMGGAPALYIEHWIDILSRLNMSIPFHSDLLLMEKSYDTEVLKDIAKFNNGLYAVSIKGIEDGSFYANTGVSFEHDLFWSNFEKVYTSGINFYVTFTGMDKYEIKQFKREASRTLGVDCVCAGVFDNSFSIDIVNYLALK